jgi:hypothetical protein
VSLAHAARWTAGTTISVDDGDERTLAKLVMWRLLLAHDSALELQTAEKRGDATVGQ